MCASQERNIDKRNREGSGNAALSRLRRTLLCLPGVLLAYVLACLFHTQTVLADLSALGVPVSLGERAQMTVHDLWGLWRYGLTIAMAMGLGFLIMSFVARRLSMPPWLTLALGGCLAIATMLLAMAWLLPMTPIASARSMPGFLLQCAAGGIGGAVAGLNLTIWKNFASISNRASGESGDGQRES